MTALKRIKANTVEKRLLTPGGNPNFGISFYIINAKGQYAGVSMYAEEAYPGETYKSQYAICTEQVPQTLPAEPLLNEKLIASA